MTEKHLNLAERFLIKINKTVSSDFDYKEVNYLYEIAAKIKKADTGIDYRFIACLEWAIDHFSSKNIDYILDIVKMISQEKFNIKLLKYIYKSYEEILWHIEIIENWEKKDELRTEKTLPLAMKVAAQTIGIDLISVKPSIPDIMDTGFNEFKYGEIKGKFTPVIGDSIIIPNAKYILPDGSILYIVYPQS